MVYNPGDILELGGYIACGETTLFSSVIRFMIHFTKNINTSVKSAHVTSNSISIRSSVGYVKGYAFDDYESFDSNDTNKLDVNVQISKISGYLLIEMYKKDHSNFIPLREDKEEIELNNVCLIIRFDSLKIEFE